jgi:hypothetical protein
MKLNKEVLGEMRFQPGEPTGLDARSTKCVTFRLLCKPLLQRRLIQQSPRQTRTANRWYSIPST